MCFMKLECQYCGMKVWYSRVGKWVVSGNEGLTEEGVVMVFVCLVHSTSGS